MVFCNAFIASKWVTHFTTDRDLCLKPLTDLVEPLMAPIKLVNKTHFRNLFSIKTEKTSFWLTRINALIELPVNIKE